MIVIDGFNRKYWYLPKKTINWTLAIERIISTLLLSGVVFHAICVVEIHKFFIAYTQWGLILSTIMFIIINLTTVCPACCKEMNTFGEIFYETMWSSECIISAIFWLILFPYTIYIRRKMDFSSMMYNFEAHGLPLILLYWDRRYNDFSFNYSHIPFIFIPLFPYALIAFLFSYLKNLTMYPILDWKDWKSILAIIVLCSLCILGFYIGKCLRRQSYSPIKIR